MEHLRAFFDGKICIIWAISIADHVTLRTFKCNGKDPYWSTKNNFNRFMMGSWDSPCSWWLLTDFDPPRLKVQDSKVDGRNRNEHIADGRLKRKYPYVPKVAYNIITWTELSTKDSYLFKLLSPLFSLHCPLRFPPSPSTSPVPLHPMRVRSPSPEKPSQQAIRTALWYLCSQLPG